MNVPYAKLCSTETSVSRHYYIYLNTITTNWLQGSEYVQLYKPESGKYIVIVPLSNLSAMENREAKTVRRQRGASMIRCGRMVSSGELRKDLLNVRYHVRLDRKGWIYICLNEPFEGRTG